MPSTFGWIDYDAKERERMTRVLALFRAKESRDELGLGSIRDAIADQLFPGTSTIQTRLRYVLFVPWIYKALEDRGTTAAEIARKARRKEIELIEPLVDMDEVGILGRRARGDLKRLPSSVYWAAFRSWRIFVGATRDQEDYHASFDRIHAARARSRRRDDSSLDDLPLLTWDPAIPAPPDDFPNGASFALRPNEAEYLSERMSEADRSSLLAWLIKRGEPSHEVSFVWEHPAYREFPPAMRELVFHAHMFAEIMHGAAILYNLELARLREAPDVDEYKAALEQWAEEQMGSAMMGQIQDWNLERFWHLVVGHGHTVSARTRAFVAQWTQLARRASMAAADSESARALIRMRERALKRTHSRFDNRRALEQWTGHSGLGVANYRWLVTQRLLRDLHAGFATAKQV